MRASRGPGIDDRDDAQLLAAVARGDRDALHALHDRHAGWLLLRLRHRCGDTELVREVVQDSFVAVWEKASTWRGDGEVAAWLWRIGMNRLTDRLRRRRPWLSRGRDPQVASAEDEVLRGLEHGRLGPALDALSPELRDAMRAVVLDGMTSREAARLLGVAPGTVRSRLTRARRQLREELS